MNFFLHFTKHFLHLSVTVIFRFIFNLKYSINRIGMLKDINDWKAIECWRRFNDINTLRWSAFMGRTMIRKNCLIPLDFTLLRLKMGELIKY